MLQKQMPHQDRQGIRSVSKNYRYIATSASVAPSSISFVDVHMDPATQQRFILWEDIVMVHKDALNVRCQAKVVPFLKGADFQMYVSSLEPRRIAADLDAILDIVVSGKPVRVAAASTTNLATDNGVNARRNPVYGLEEAAMDNYRNNDNPAFRSAPRAPQLHTSERTTPSNTESHRLSGLNRPRAPQMHTTAITAITATIPAEKFIQAMVNARLGDKNAQAIVGNMYRDGEGVGKDLQAAFDWYLKAADQGYATAQNSIGNMYHLGHGVPQDYSRATYWYLKAAVQGDAHAQYNVGYSYDCGYGVDQDYAQAMEWYLKAASRGFTRAQYNVGCMHQHGQGVAQDYTAAIIWFLKAAANNSVAAQSSVGDLYYDGQGVTQDFSQAMSWYRKAAEQGHVSSQYNVGWLYQHGRGVIRNIPQAIHWYQKAANRGFALAQSNLGVLLGWGEGVSQDDQMAINLFFVAATNGCDIAQYNIGWLYENGEGVSRDKSKAVSWFTMAANQGNFSALKALERIEYSYEVPLFDMRKALASETRIHVRK